MARDYGELLAIAGELQDYNGYLDTARMQEMNGVQARFNAERRRFVYEAMRSEPDIATLKAAIDADLARIAASGNIRDDGFDYARDEIFAHIDKQAGNNGLMRFLVRWTMPALGAVAAIVYFYLKYRSLS